MVRCELFIEFAALSCNIVVDIYQCTVDALPFLLHVLLRLGGR